MYQVLQPIAESLPNDCFVREAFDAIDKNAEVGELFPGKKKFYPVIFSRNGKPCIYLTFTDTWMALAQSSHSSFMCASNLKDTLAFLFMCPREVWQFRKDINSWRDELVLETLYGDQEPSPPFPPPPPPPTVHFKASQGNEILHSHSRELYIPPQVEVAVQPAPMVNASPACPSVIRQASPAAPPPTVMSPTISTVSSTCAESIQFPPTLRTYGHRDQALFGNGTATVIITMEDYGIEMATPPSPGHSSSRTSLFGFYLDGFGCRDYIYIHEPTAVGVIEVPNLGELVNNLTDAFGFAHGVVCALGRAFECANDVNEFANMMGTIGGFSLRELSFIYHYIYTWDDQPTCYRLDIYCL
ncbi:hypothetical protein C8Q75DRAFT_802119 [Abortiporus biennis]|nr:hypothetical protein C8Q75DRAFT_802119 [Abortiporus biennis]